MIFNKDIIIIFVVIKTITTSKNEIYPYFYSIHVLNKTLKKKYNYVLKNFEKASLLLMSNFLQDLKLLFFIFKKSLLYVYIYNFTSEIIVLIFTYFLNFFDRNSFKFKYYKNTFYELTLSFCFYKLTTKILYLIKFRNLFLLIPENVFKTFWKFYYDFFFFNFDLFYFVFINCFFCFFFKALFFILLDFFFRLYNHLNVITNIFLNYFYLVYNINFFFFINIVSFSYVLFLKVYLIKSPIFGSMSFYLKKSLGNKLRSSFKGGLLLSYKFYKEYLFMYDVNVFYSSIMFLTQLPLGFKKIVLVNIVKMSDFICQLSKNFFGFVAVTLKILNFDFLSFAFFTTLGIFQSSSIIQLTLFSEEFFYILNLGNVLVLKVHFILECSKGFLFRNFINQVYLNKKSFLFNFNLTIYPFYKLLINSLYGRFGLKESYVRYFFFNLENIKHRLRYFILKSVYLILSETCLNFFLVLKVNLVYLELTFDLFFKFGFDLFFNLEVFTLVTFINNFIKKRSVYPQVASAISAYGRIFLYDWILRIHRWGGFVFYADTDSFFTNLKLVDNFFFFGSLLGQLKLEKKIYRVYVLSAKVYFLIDSRFCYIIRFRGIFLSDSSLLNEHWFLMRLIVYFLINSSYDILKKKLKFVFFKYFNILFMPKFVFKLFKGSVAQ